MNTQQAKLASIQETLRRNLKYLDFKGCLIDTLVKSDVTTECSSQRGDLSFGAQDDSIDV